MKNVNVEEILNKAQEMQGQFQKMQESFLRKEITVIAGVEDEENIFVKATIDGARQIKSIIIGKGAQAQDPDVLADLVKDAINKATRKLNEDMQKEVQSIYQSSGIPTEGAGTAGNITA